MTKRSLVPSSVDRKVRSLDTRPRLVSIACSCTAAPALRGRRAISRCSPQQMVLRPALAAPHAWARALRPLHGRQPWHISASGDPGPSTEQVSRREKRRALSCRARPLAKFASQAFGHLLQWSAPLLFLRDKTQCYLTVIQDPSGSRDYCTGNLTCDPAHDTAT